jgi:hypothetical protein
MGTLGHRALEYRPGQRALHVAPCASLHTHKPGDRDQQPEHADVAQTQLPHPYGPLQAHSKLLKLPYDILDPTVGFVANDKEALLNLCRVSKALYMGCVPWIYRHVTIRFSDLEGPVLLERFCNTGSQIYTHVRTLALKDCGHASMLHWALLLQTLSRFTRLENLSWDSHASIPGCVLDKIHACHPCTSIQAYVSQVYDGNAFHGE